MTTLTQTLPGPPPRPCLSGINYSANLHTKDPVPSFALVMTNVIYENCNFVDTPFYTSELTNVSFVSCNFRLANFNMTSFYNCEFTNCDLTDADLYCSEFHNTSFTDSPLEHARLFHALVPSSLLLLAGYARDRKHNAPINPSLVIYDPAWVAALPEETGASPAMVDLLLDEHSGQTPTLITALLHALSS